MTHIEFSANGNVGSLVVDGFDLTPHVLRRGLRIELTEEGALVHAILFAKTVRADLPDAVLSAIVEAGE